MSRETLLDDAIAKAKEAEDWQLVEWLRMARSGESAARWYTEKLRDSHRVERKLLNENAKLRELVRDMWGTMGLLDACAVDEYDEPLNCCTVCNQYGSVDDLAGGKRVIGCKLMYRMCELGVDE